MRVRRSRIRIVLFVVVIPVLVLIKVVNSVVDEASNAHEFDLYRSSFAFVLDRDNACTFRFSERPPFVKIVTNASVDRQVPVGENESFEYVVAIQALDGSDGVLERREYTLRARRTFAFESHTGEVIPSHLYLEPELVPASSKVVMLPMSEFPDATAQLRIRIMHMDPALQDVSVRVLQQDPPPDYKLYYVWHRMSWERKQRLAQFNLYGPEALRTDEVNNLLKTRLASVAPLGIEGRDFHRRRIYVYESSPARSSLTRIEPHGRVATPDQHAVVPVPNFGALILWRFRPLDSGEHFPEGANVQLRTIDPVTGRLATESVDLSGPEVRFAEDPGRSTVELRSTTPLVANLYVFLQNQWVEVTPSMKWVPTYLSQWGLPLVYDVSDGVPVRIHLRQLLAAGETASPQDVSFVRFAAKDADGQVLAANDLIHRGGVSRHDDPIGNYRDCSVSESSRHYLRLPEGTRKLSIESFTERVSVSVYTRPAELPRRVRVPDDYDDFARDHDGIDPRPESRSWFPLHPRNVDRWIEENRRVVIGVQREPRSSNGDASRSSVVVEPDSPRARVPLLVRSRRPITAPTRWHLSELTVGEPRELLFAGVGGQRKAPLGVLVVGAERAGTVELSLDGLRCQVPFDPSNSQLEAPVGVLGSHRVQLESDPGARVFVTGVSASPGATTFRRRSGRELDAELTYRVQNVGTEGEMISVYVWVPVNDPLVDVPLALRAELQFRTTTGVATDRWTYPVTEFQVGFDEDATQAIALSGTRVRYLERVLFLPLGTDVVAGEVVLRLHRVTGPSCLVQVVRTHSHEERSHTIYATDRVEERD